jgi:hypothetical protein
MAYLKTFNDLKAEGFSDEIALYTTILVSINYSIEPTIKEMSIPGEYTKRLEKLFESALSELNIDDKQLCLNLWKVHYSYGIGKDLSGLGGCATKTYKQLLLKGETKWKESKNL